MVIVGESLFLLKSSQGFWILPVPNKKQNSSAIIIWHTPSAIKNHAVHDGTCVLVQATCIPLPWRSEIIDIILKSRKILWVSTFLLIRKVPFKIYNHVHKYLLGPSDATQSKRSRLPPSPSVPRPQPHARRGDARLNCSWRLRRTCHVPGHETGIKLNLHPPFTVGELTWTHLEDRKTFYTTWYAKEYH